MATEIEKLAEEIFFECYRAGEPVTGEEAVEMAKMELNEKANRHYEKSDAPRKKTEKVRKVDEVKKKFINGFRVYLEGCGAKVEPLTNETDLHFTYLGENYSIKLSKHRPKK